MTSFNPNVKQDSLLPECKNPSIIKIKSLETVQPYLTEIEIPKNKKILINAGYHYFEKPFGILFEKMFKDQVSFNSDEIEFMHCKNRSITTGEISIDSEREIQQKVKEGNFTNLIDIHEQTSVSNHYMREWDGERIKWRDGSKSGVQEFTVDPTIPGWCIEIYFENGIISPQLQYAINDQIKMIESHIKMLS